MIPGHEANLQKLFNTWYRDKGPDAEFIRHWLDDLLAEIQRKPRIPPEEFQHMFCPLEHDAGALERMAYTTERLAEDYGLVNKPVPDVEGLACKHGVEGHSDELRGVVEELADLLRATKFEPEQIDTVAAKRAWGLIDDLLDLDLATPGERRALEWMRYRLAPASGVRKNQRTDDFYLHAERRLEWFWQNVCGREGTSHETSNHVLSPARKFVIDAIGRIEKHVIGVARITPSTLRNAHDKRNREQREPLPAK